MSIGSDHIKSAEPSYAFAQLDIGSASRHVRRDRHGAMLSGARDDRSFRFIVARIENLMRNLAEASAQPFGFLDTRRPDQNRLSSLMNFSNFLDHSRLFFRPCTEDFVRMIDADHRTVRRNYFNIEFVDAAEFFGLRSSRPRHATDEG